MQEAGSYAVTQFKRTHSDLQTCGVTDVHTETSPGSQRSRSLSQYSISTAGSTSLLHNNAYIILKAVCSTNDSDRSSITVLKLFTGHHGRANTEGLDPV